MKKFLLITFILLEELLFSLINVNSIHLNIYILLFTLITALIIDLISSIFKEKINKLIYCISVSIITLTFIIYTIFYKLLGSILSINSIINGTTQAIGFSDVLVKEILKNWYNILIILIPLVLLFIFTKKIPFKKLQIKETLIQLSIVIVAFIATIAMINVFSNKTEIYSPQNLYYNIHNPNENLKKFGLITTIRLDLQRSIFGFKEKYIYVYEDEVGNKKVISSNEYNIEDIDFDNISNENRENKEIQEICEYLQSIEPTKKNEYTGKFAGKNLIVFIAESFSKLAINENITPTLYKMANNGYIFENFYTPLFPVSTADGEYLTDTSLIPVEGIWTIEKCGDKTFPYSYPNVLKEKGYKTFAYHDYDYNYYHRESYFEALGYDKYLGNGNGLENYMDFSEKPASDYEMVKSTVSDYINEEHFVTYYLTISGHINYDNNNAMVRKNWDLVKDLPYSDNVKGYLATQIELDRALEELLKHLEEKDRLNDTVILMVGDHYPYGLKANELQELSDKKMDNEFDKYHMPFILYDATQKDKIVVEKYASSLDVLPTILNLFGVEYDSRLLMGRDIFSTAEPLIIFSDRSFITSKGSYNSWTGNFVKEIEEELDINKYIKEIKQQIYYKYRYSRLIFENDFYKLIN